MLPPELAAALAPGTVIDGKYRIERPLGTGGMGVVVAARHLELNQNLAIKVLLPSATSSHEAITRFLREGRAAAQVTSPHVAKVHDTGRLPSGAPYLVMELLRGADLREHLARVRRVPLAQAIEWTLQAAHALAEAHALQIIHRDVKPANLFLAETSAGQQIKVLDFGISKQLDSVEAALTNTTSAIGTPRYMAPEQMRSPKLADARGDVWSLGIVLYELATGRYPFQGDTITALCFDIMERTPAPPSTLNPDLPVAFDELVARCLEKDPDERFQSMTALATALAEIAPGVRSSGLFTSASWQLPAPASGTTPPPSVPTPEPADPTTHQTVLGPPVFPESPPQETMRAWDTTAVPRTAPKKRSRAPLLALGVGIGIACATLVGVVIGRQSGATTSARVEPRLSFAVRSTLFSVAAPVAPPLVPTAVDRLEPPIVLPESSVSSDPVKTTTKTGLGAGSCTPPYTLDSNNHRVPKPHCWNK